MCCGRLQREVFCLRGALSEVCLSSHKLLLPSNRHHSQPCPAKSTALVDGASKAKREQGQDLPGSRGSGCADLPLVVRAGQGRVLLLLSGAGSGDTQPWVPAPRGLAAKGLGAFCRLLFAFSPPLCFLCELVSFGGERLALHRLRFPFVSEALSPFAPFFHWAEGCRCRSLCVLLLPGHRLWHHLLQPLDKPSKHAAAVPNQGTREDGGHRL